ncbi:putative 2-aminoethylphosphonate ABC transporter substrate-binding protein [Phreatobacter oligotrophus]|uniref:Iron(III) transport system substrate-binding protein n=1 Tax=Phreatobacter oligotrophus TaxID=1122261 RepID=A0A2T4Z096_9HYPH|nr:putative 2-aminoethylphosphonate ABC transporter substrate-binding protein [Phreatobacter oligotrophus]PTM52910.1 iron(III) transport system substrate-binding protein [Phreatobacter oligotrophus]
MVGGAKSGLRGWLAAIAVSLVAAAAPAAAQQRTLVTLYSAVETDQLSVLKQAIETDMPDIEVRWVRDSTGVITARVLAERATPRADMILGLAATSLLLFAEQDLLEPYRPAGVDQLKPAFQDRSAAYRWTGMDAYVAAICFNRDEARKVGAPAINRWSDLLHPSLRQRIVMPHPASSGTGFLLVSGWIQMMGEEAAWRFMEQLHESIALYTHSGSAPCVQAGRGERVVGLSFDMRGARERTNGAPIDVVVPEDGAGWEMEAFALMRNRPPAQAAAARRIADWAASKRANELYAQFYAVVAHRDVANKPANYPPFAEARMLRSDFSWMAQNRDRILSEWSRRFDQRLPAPR